MAAQSQSSNQLVEFVAKYKEVLAFIGVAGALVVACINFFATKDDLTAASREVDILRCEVDLGKTALENRIEEDRLGKEIVDLRMQLLNAKKGLATDAVVALELKIEMAKGALVNAQAAYMDAASKLNARFCRRQGVHP